MTDNGREWTVSRYLLSRLQQAGIRHLFGVPGDYVLDFLDEVIASPLRWIGTCNELNAGYAADGYARVNGIGAAVVTYCVGGFSILNAVAGAYAERVPLLLISGAPPARRRESGAIVHHLVSDYYLQLDVFRKVTIDGALLSNPEMAPDEIDRVLGNGLARKLPMYLEVPADTGRARCRAPGALTPWTPVSSDTESLADAVAEAAQLVDESTGPAVLVGIEAKRFGVAGAILKLVEAVELPFATMLSSKAALPELHPQFIGIYQGSFSSETVRRQVESSDCLLSLGAWMTEFDTGLFTENLDPRRTVSAVDGTVHIRNHHYRHVELGDFVRGLTRAIRPRSYVSSHPAGHFPLKRCFHADHARVLTASRLYECMNSFLDDSMVLLAETGDASCAAPDLYVEEAENFIVQASYMSIGYCTAAALGVALACPSKRPVVITGDGAFQMTAQEISTLLRHRCPGVFVLINNDGYLIERMLHADGPYNDIQTWDYAGLPAVFGADNWARGVRVTTEGELAVALQLAAKEPSRLYLIEAVLAQQDCSARLSRLGAEYRRNAGVMSQNIRATV